MRPTRVPFGLIGTLALVAAVESSVTTPTNPLADIWADAYARADSDEVRASAILCLGDSQIKLGIKAAALGESAYNLAVHAGQPAAAEALLRRALDAGARPRTLVLGFCPDLLGFPAGTNAGLWPEVLGVAGSLGLAIEAGDSHLAARAVLGAILPTCRARDDIRRTARAALKGEPDPVDALMVRVRRERAEARGSVVTAPGPGLPDEPAPGPAARPWISGWSPKRENLVALRRLLALAKARGIAVAWVMPTFSPTERARRDLSGLAGSYARFLRGVQAEFPGLVVLDPSGLDLDRSVFLDPIHLDGRGATALTAAVARAIVQGGPRWVVLGPTDVAAGAIARGSRSDVPR